MRCTAGIVAAVAVALSACAARSGDPQAPTTIKDLVSHPIEVRQDTPADASAPKAMENYRKFLELQNTDPKLRAEALRRLGDLNLESGQLERMEN
jgi:cellulose synthase operon protein C